MPELPEVEHARRTLERWLTKHAVVKAHAGTSRVFRDANRAAFTRLRGKAKRVTRHGKALLVELQNGATLSHLGMTGKWVRSDSKTERWSKASFELDDGSVVHYVDPRMFGRLQPMSPAQFDEHIAALGVDPLTQTFTARTLQQALGRTKQPLKVALMDQARVAGIGNIQASEALYRAKLSPERQATTLNSQEWSTLVKAIKASIAYTLKQQGDGDTIVYVEEANAPNPFWVYGRQGEPCRRCKTPIASKSHAGRTSFYCPKCQR